MLSDMDDEMYISRDSPMRLPNSRLFGIFIGDGRFWDESLMDCSVQMIKQQHQSQRLFTTVNCVKSLMF